MSGVEGMERKTAHIRWLAADLCERRDHTIRDWINFYTSIHEEVKNDENKKKCILEGIRMYNHKMSCDIKGAIWIIDYLEKYAVDDRLVMVCDMARENAQSNVGKSASCATQKRKKRQFDTMSLISMINGLVCNKRMYSALLSEMENELGKENPPFTEVFIESFCCIFTK